MHIKDLAASARDAAFFLADLYLSTFAEPYCIRGQTPMNPLTMPPSAGINEDAGAPATRGRERTVAQPMHAAMERSGAVSRDERAGGLPSPAPQRRVVTKRRGLTIGYVVDRFPRAPHDFVFQEILELHSLGIEVNVSSISMPD